MRVDPDPEPQGPYDAGSVVGRETGGEVALDGDKDVAIAVDGKQYRLRHAGYVPDVFAAPLRCGGYGGCTSVSSA